MIAPKGEAESGSSCSTTDTTILRKRLVKILAGRAGSVEAASLSGVARQAYDELAAVLVPLVSRTGFDALLGRAFDLARREYPAKPPPDRDAGQQQDPFFQIGLWVDQQDRRNAIEAAAAVFAALAGLLITLIGESLADTCRRRGPRASRRRDAKDDDHDHDRQSSHSTTADERHRPG